MMVAAFLVSGSGAVRAQAPLSLVDEQTRVASIHFKFVDGRTFDAATLQEQILLTEVPSFAGLRKRLSFIPFVPEVGVHPFLPIEMAKDVVRIERYYNQNGFLRPEVDWLVSLDSAKNVVSVTYTVREGPPLLLQRVDLRGADGQPAYLQFPGEVQEKWVEFRDSEALATGRRLGEFDLVRLQDHTLSWVRDNGYPFSRVEATTVVDSLANTIEVEMLVDAGPRARIDEIQVEGTESIDAQVVLRELPFKVGDRYSRQALVEGQRHVFALDLLETALIDVLPDQPEDSTVTVRVRVREGKPRIVTASAGYLSESGAAAEGSWIHRNFLGGARTLTATLTALSGIGAFSADPDVLYRAGATLHQPYFLNRRLAVSVTPTVEVRDNFIDESTAYSGSAALLYTWGPFEKATLQYTFETRFIRSFNYGSVVDTEDSTTVRLVDLFEALLLDSGRINRSSLTLSGLYGLAPARQGSANMSIRPSVELAGPAFLSTDTFGRFGLDVSGFVPITRSVGVFGRLTGGWLTPFVQSLPGEERSSFLTLLNLRDAIFFAGGTGDVRGWGNNLLGPKLLDLVLREEVDATTSDTTLAVSASPYFPIGSLTKLSGTLEARLPFPGLGPTWGTHLFVDAGRVWTTDDRFDLPPSFLVSSTYSDDEQFFYGVGGGFSLSTPVGDVQLSVGYKLNPSFFDLRDPVDIAAAVEDVLAESVREGTMLTDEDLVAAIGAVETAGFPVFGLFTIPERGRLHLHFSIGHTF